MKNRTLIRTGIAGTAIAMLCCLTPVLTLLFGVIGLAAWLAWADYVLLPALLMFMAIAAFDFYRARRSKAEAACCDAEAAGTHGAQL